MFDMALAPGSVGHNVGVANNAKGLCSSLASLLC